MGVLQNSMKETQENNLNTYDNVAVLIPCYNESITISSVIQDFQKMLPKCTVYVYDNNSTDGTDKIAADCGAVVRYEKRQGKGNVLRRMFREIQADCYVLVDGDNTYPAESAPEMVRLIFEQNYDMVIGDRLSSTYFSENKRKFHNFGNSLVRSSVNHIFNCDVKDIMTGYRAFSRQFVKTFPILTQKFEIETEMTIHAVDKNMAVCSIPVAYRDRPKGSTSKLNTFQDGFKVIKTIIKTFAVYKPLMFWLMFALLFGIVGTTMFAIVLKEYFETGIVARFPTLIVSCFLLLIAIISFFTGVILQTLRHKEKQDFEFRLIELHEREILK